MPRSFEVSFSSPATVEQIHGAFADEAYWLARLASMQGGTRTLQSLTVDPDRRVRVVAVEDLRHGAMPGMLAKVYRGDLNVVTTETWTPAADGRVEGTVTVAVTGAPGSGHGSGTLAPSGAGSRLSMAATVQFDVPLVGGRVENFLCRQLADGLGHIQQFTTSWVGEHG
ncbi:MAG TPA: DUF2505 domain-containing protein [Mycobacterium sp.]|nr:DUF2505 domain-containing protein [Mycobacterium sp.]